MRFLPEKCLFYRYIRLCFLRIILPVTSILFLPDKIEDERSILFLPDEIEDESAVDVTIHLRAHVRIPVVVNFNRATVGKINIVQGSAFNWQKKTFTEHCNLFTQPNLCNIRSSIIITLILIHLTKDPQINKSILMWRTINGTTLH